MSGDPAFPFYVDNFLSGVHDFSMAERGVYITLLCYQWTHGNIPKKRLGFILGLDWECAWEKVREKFTEVDADFVRNERLELEREKRRAFLEKQRNNGALGGRKPKRNPNHNPNATQTITQTQSQTQPNPEPKQEPKRNPLILNKVYNIDKEYYNDLSSFLIYLDNVYKSGDKKIFFESAFDFFWCAYDKKRDLMRTKKRFMSLTVENVYKVLNAVEKYVESTPDKQFRKDPNSWLINECWENEIIEPSKKNAPPEKEETVISRTTQSVLEKNFQSFANVNINGE